MARTVVTVRLEKIAADFLAACVGLLVEVENADPVLIPDAVAAAAGEARAALEAWRADHS